MELADIMHRVLPKVKEDIKYEHGKKISYMKLIKALYDCIESLLLWYNTFTKKLKEIGFQLKSYNLCIANKDIEGTQCTVLWYVDNVKVSHKKQQVIDEVVKNQHSSFGKSEI